MAAFALEVAKLHSSSGFVCPLSPFFVVISRTGMGSPAGKTVVRLKGCYSRAGALASHSTLACMMFGSDAEALQRSGSDVALFGGHC